MPLFPVGFLVFLYIFLGFFFLRGGDLGRVQSLLRILFKVLIIEGCQERFDEQQKEAELSN